jgi:hypothetical protein
MTSHNLLGLPAHLASKGILWLIVATKRKIPHPCSRAARSLMGIRDVDSTFVVEKFPETAFVTIGILGVPLSPSPALRLTRNDTV